MRAVAPGSGSPAGPDLAPRCGTPPFRSRVIPCLSTGNRDSLSTARMAQSGGPMDDAPPDYDDGPPDDYEPAPRRSGSGTPTKGRVPPHNLAAEESLLG